MRLTKYTDYGIRVLIHLGLIEGELGSIREIAAAFDISQDHLKKVVNDLSGAGFIESVRGRNGGIRLARPPEQINLGSVLRHTEGLDELIECAGCPIAPACGVPPVLAEASAAFAAVFDKYTVADLIVRKPELRQFLGADQVRFNACSK
ncbi:Rrf2 family transcriptional regulator [Sinorhizobium meliloti]|uniref:Rrf2 family transcriptional regulator n=1 Tax=Rhizobium meliloti TaxID=382 RepID=UPI001295025E|nr:Rrf2 family transcriptional regulator [Sinorhizobium meliloti]MDW9594937.1 Rrf2 family transcriptional regulator [Sinorhizobium meliloti]MDX0189916.1 Rrf2 family transcriptional regulator [Sinorhizobium meliloti]MQV09916.1 Rrf2 family transcriptional regulator [Sinorhizobium meliloti]MQV61076.1 Rrf2 family transcriptional regulator [Sinorhizobium meliloti]